MHVRMMLVLAVLVTSSCEDNGHDDVDAHVDEHAHADGGNGGCGDVANCEGTVDLEEGLAIEGKHGKFTLTVDSHNTLAPEDNQWGVTLTDSAGDAVGNATLTVDVWSVDCLHGGPLPPEDIETDADGKALLQPVTAHGGPWDVIVKVKSGSVSDTITVHLCISGDGHPGTHLEADEDAGG